MVHFADRLDAARRMVARLQHLKGRDPVVVGIPRGAVPMARVIADELGGDLDVALVHKVGHPQNPEFAIGAVDELGNLVAGDERWATLHDLAPLARREVDRLRERRHRYSGSRPSTDVRDRLVVVVDDGLATGLTMVAALRSLRARGARYLVAAAPVASDSALDLVRAEADEVVVLGVPAGFGAVGYYYDDFTEVTDDDVVACLAEGGARPAAASA